MKYRPTDRNFTDPVCGMVLSRTTALAEADHGGKTYYFCAIVCREAFLENPDSYLPKHRQRGMPAK